jgi:hypothetical protein
VLQIDPHIDISIDARTTHCEIKLQAMARYTCSAPFPCVLGAVLDVLINKPADVEGLAA